VAAGDDPRHRIARGCTWWERAEAARRRLRLSDLRVKPDVSKATGSMALASLPACDVVTAGADPRMEETLADVCYYVDGAVGEGGWGAAAAIAVAGGFHAATVTEPLRGVIATASRAEETAICLALRRAYAGTLCGRKPTSIVVYSDSREALDRLSSRRLRSEAILEARLLNARLAAAGVAVKFVHLSVKAANCPTWMLVADAEAKASIPNQNDRVGEPREISVGEVRAAVRAANECAKHRKEASSSTTSARRRLTGGIPNPQLRARSKVQLSRPEEEIWNGCRLNSVRGTPALEGALLRRDRGCTICGGARGDAEHWVTDCAPLGYGLRVQLRPRLARLCIRFAIETSAQSKHRLCNVFSFRLAADRRASRKSDSAQRMPAGPQLFSLESMTSRNSHFLNCTLQIIAPITGNNACLALRATHSALRARPDSNPQSEIPKNEITMSTSSRSTS